MVNWIILGVLILLILLFLKFRYARHRFYVIIVLLILIFAYISVSNVIKKNNINIMTISGMVSAGKIYFNWLGQIFKNIKGISTSAIKMDWAGNLTK